MTTPDPSTWAPAGRPDLDSFVPRDRRVAPLLLWLVCLGSALALLLWLGDGRLAAPDLTDPTSWSAWVAERSTAEAVVAVLRIVALGLAWYLAGVTAVSVLAHAARAARLVRVADALAVGPVRTLVQQALGVGLAVGVVASALPPAASGGADTRTTPAVAVDEEGSEDHRLLSSVGTAPDVSAARGRDDGTVRAPVPAPRLVATSLDDEPVTGDGPVRGDATVEPTPTGDAGGATASTDERPAPPPTVAPRDRRTTDDTPREVTIEAGDHLWGVAEDDLRNSLGREPTEHEVHDHWDLVVAANTDRLVVPSNPDLLHPGQRIVLPDVAVHP